MAMMSGSDFYAYVLRAFKRTDKSTEVYEAITDTLYDIATRTHLDERKVESYTSGGITSTSDYRIDLPADFGRLVGDIRFTDDNDSWTLTKLSKQEFNEKFPDPDGSDPIDGQPTHYTIYDSQIFLGPLPDRTTYVYQLDYSTIPDAITSATTEVPFTGLHRETIRFGTLARLYDALGEPTLAESNRQNYEIGLERMKERDRANVNATIFVKQTEV